MPFLSPILLARLLAFAALLTLAAGLGACSGTSGTRGDQAALDPIEPVFRGADAGLEAHLWVVQGRAGVLPAVFGALSPPDADPRTLDLWRRNGIRAVEVPIDQLDALQARLPTIGPRNREWLGLLPEWVEVAASPSIAPSTPIQLDSGVARLGPGRLRLLARCWVTPFLAQDASQTSSRMRLEVMPELEMPRAQDQAQALLLEEFLSQAERPTGRSLPFDRLTLGWTAQGETALVLIPESPDADWAAPAPGRPESETPDLTGFGPDLPEIPTLGQLLMTNLVGTDMPGDARLVVVLIPRVPDRFNVLPR